MCVPPLVLIVSTLGRSTIIYAGTDTTSSAMARTLLCLAEHPDIQQRLRAEIIDAFHDRELDYDRMMALPYLHAIFQETLRL